MFFLIARHSGEKICELSESDLAVLRDRFVRSSETTSDYFLNEESLRTLKDTTMSEDVLCRLINAMKPAGLDLGLEKESRQTGERIEGKLVSEDGRPLGGIRVLSLSHEHRVVNWTHSRPDGTYSLPYSTREENEYLRFSARGGLILTEFAIGDEQDQGETTIQALTGTVTSKTGVPIPGISVQLLGWKDDDSTSFEHLGTLGGTLSWDDTNEEGHFSVPIRLDQVEHDMRFVLELLAPKGETLRKLTVPVSPEGGLALGQIVAPLPSEQWGGKALTPKRSVVMYPGVSERPLS
jgi:hypothetical protein